MRASYLLTLLLLTLCIIITFLATDNTTVYARKATKPRVVVNNFKKYRARPVKTILKLRKLRKLNKKLNKTQKLRKVNRKLNRKLKKLNRKLGKKARKVVQKIALKVDAVKAKARLAKRQARLAAKVAARKARLAKRAAQRKVEKVKFEAEKQAKKIRRLTRLVARKARRVARLLKLAAKQAKQSIATKLAAKKAKLEARKVALKLKKVKAIAKKVANKVVQARKVAKRVAKKVNAQAVKAARKAKLAARKAVKKAKKLAKKLNKKLSKKTIMNTTILNNTNSNSNTSSLDWTRGVDLNNLRWDETIYYYIRSNYSEFEITVWVSIAYLFIMYTVLGLPWWLLKTFKPKFLYKYKLQPNKEETRQTDWGCILQLTINHLSVIPLLYFNYPILKWRGTSYDLPLPSWTDMLLRSLIFLIIEDAWFYWIHRFLHTEWGYKNIHCTHHEYQTPIGYCSSYASLIEFLILGVGSFIGPFAIGCPHIVGWWVWMTIRQIEAMDCHTGFDFPWSLHNIIPFYCGAVHHDHHHKTYNGNFASTFTWWDYYMGTDKAYRDWLKKYEAKKVKTQ
ncbi:hypothetical protein ABK040_014476 [Willaertia magna]